MGHKVFSSERGLGPPGWALTHSTPHKLKWQYHAHTQPVSETNQSRQRLETQTGFSRDTRLQTLPYEARLS